jgi:lipoate-protein ligase A
VVSTIGSAADLHNRQIPGECGRLVWSHRVDRPAIVLGSAQPQSQLLLETTTAIEVVRRRSGGGVVLVRPDDTWIDVLIGRNDQLWTDDVGQAFHWLGGVWEQAFGALGITATMHTGPMQGREAGRVVCFAGLGPGELVDSGGVKLLGLSQRRTRNVARFQCLVPHRSPLGETIAYLDPDAVPDDIGTQTEIGSTLDQDVLATTFLTELARLP